MLKVLLVDDNPDKVRRVLEALYSMPGILPNNVDVAYTARDARIRLLSTAYDLLILDVALPEQADLQPAVDVGIALLKDICGRERYRPPSQIIGLTAFSDALIQASPEFTDELWHVIRYDASSTDWIMQLSKKVRYLFLASTNKGAVEYDCDLCIVTALEVPENSSVLSIPWGWQLREIENEVATFREGFFENHGIRRRVIAACTNRMGMTSAAVLATKAIYCFRPRYIAMAGIAAGIRGDCNLGDVIVADPTWDYGSGKWASNGSGRVFEMAPRQLPLCARIRNRFERLTQDQVTLKRIQEEWTGTKPESDLRIIIGPMASGAAVRADGDAGREVRAQHRKAIAIEMEGFGVMAAAHEAPLPEVESFIVKSVCDFADGDKSDDFQAYAAYTSANVLRVFAENYLPI